MSATLIPIRKFMRACRSRKNELKFADSTGMSLNGGRALLTALVFRRVLHRLLAPDEKNVGLLMPTSVYGILANLGLALNCRTSVNLNYTFSTDTINYCIKRAEVRHVITSKKVLDRFPNLELNADLIVMEDIAKQVTFLDKLTAFIDAYITPIPCLEWAFGLDKVPPDDLITIIFTSGSTGTPKGAMITQGNVAANVGAFFKHIEFTDEDRLLGTLPLFHAYGYATAFWLPATSGVAGIYHFNPLEPKKIAETARKFGCTVFPTTPTFLRSYLRRSQKEDYETLKLIICGAEKLPADLIDAWEAKFDVRPGEGYGVTELSPVVATNVPKGRRKDYKDWLRDGTIGRPLFNVKARIVQPETGEVLPNDTPGMLEISGPSVMKGYYNDPEKTKEVLKDGWYITGDIATIDNDGFIRIVGRQSRISKIGGEMVPHILVEDEICKVLAGANSNTDKHADDTAASDELQVAVAAVPDDRKGERLIILHTALPKTPAEICKALQTAGLPNIWIPSPNDFHQIETIPLLGTGKLDLRAVKELAQQVAGND
ncbi:MAG: AMP-binding protein [Planctomycetaceae bacterium]|jgi:acyl-[acyl-carrier-protein]-phospholipid O-acyltransferase/long-chain-fatty-acid--[acyl-carrier-protein] ligase|nr:AMP-binding protein [Planctomycetaceae bacterium]